jgi:chemotaxis methyl-accepting protein methylase
MKQLFQDQALIHDYLTASEGFLPPTFMTGSHVAFRCNVPIYFDSANQRRVLQHFYNNLLPNSYSFLGHSESLLGVNGDIQSVHFSGSGAYLKSVPRRKL